MYSTVIAKTEFILLAYRLLSLNDSIIYTVELGDMFLYYNERGHCSLF